MTGAAPIPFEILQFFRSLGVPLSEVYGLSETSGPMTWTPFRVKVGTVGPRFPGVEVVLDADGEVLTRGGNVFRGYLNAPEQDRRGVRRRRLVPHRRHRRARRGRLPQDRRPQEGTDHHRGRQEHLAGEPRSRAEGRAADRAGVRDRRQPAVHLRAARARRRGRTRLGQGARHRRDRSRRARRASGRAGRSRARSRRGERALLAGREGQALDAARGGVAPRLGGAHADDEAQAPRRAPQVRRRDRRACTRRGRGVSSRGRARRGRGRGRGLRRARGWPAARARSRRGRATG